MSARFIVANDRQAREISAEIEAISHALSSEQVLKAIVGGLPHEVIEGVRRSLTYERRELVDAAAAYERAKAGDITALEERAAGDPGAMLIVARIAKGWPQKELARRLGLPEQQVQRYESERYRSISLAGFQRVARALDVQLSATVQASAVVGWFPVYEISATEVQRALKHARSQGWLKAGTADENATAELKRLVAEHVGEHGTPSLLRTGLNVEEHREDWILLAWKAQVTRRAKAIISKNKLRYRPLDVTWLTDLVRLSSLDDGPVRALHLLQQNGIVLIVEPQIPGMKVDGAAFLVDEIPVIGLTLLRDRLDNFWFTLMHEVAHVILHYRTGLRSGFFDDIERAHRDEFEREADSFAGNLLIPDHVWARSPARISKSTGPVERLARELSIAPAIIFGRIRLERNNYSIFSQHLGQGHVRKQFLRKDEKIGSII